MGHIGARALSELPKRVKGVEKTLKIKKKDYDVCIQSKITAKISRKPLENGSNYLELIYSDIKGPYTSKIIGGNKFYVTFLDLITKWAEVRLLKFKDEVYNSFIKYITLEERNSGRILKRLYTDNGLKYKNEEFRALFIKKDSKTTFSAPYSP
jgi:hypothetical protein